MFVETTKDIYAQFVPLFYDLYPEIAVTLVACDDNLARLGFVDNAPCVFQIDITEDRYLEILDELIQIEIDAFNTKGGKNPPESDPLYQRYLKYGWIWDLLFTAKDDEK